MTQPQTLHRQINPKLRYSLRLANPDSPHWMILVHGINRDTQGLLSWFGPQADLAEVNLIIPIFDPIHYPDYQRLGRTGLGARADLALLNMLSDVASFMQRRLEPFSLFGFSGGAQFAHRFTLAHGDCVGALIMAAAGWYTPLNAQQRFPYGTAGSKRLPGLQFQPDYLLRIPTLTLIGDQDTQIDSSVRSNPSIDAEQGHNRLQRAHWWHSHLTQLTRVHNQLGRHLIQVMPGCDHNFGNCALQGELAAKAIAFHTLTTGRYVPTTTQEAYV